MARTKNAEIEPPAKATAPKTTAGESSTQAPAAATAAATQPSIPATSPTRPTRRRSAAEANLTAPSSPVAPPKKRTRESSTVEEQPPKAPLAPEKDAEGSVGDETSQEHDEGSSSADEEGAEGNEGDETAMETSQSDDEGTSSSATEEDNEAMRPNGFLLPPDLLKVYPKVSTRCNPHRAFNVIKTLTAKEKKWFTHHPQFKHFFHMELLENRMCMGLWMLAVRTVDTGDRSQCWFMVNGVPMRYSIREHGLISGLHCHNYPGDLDMLGNKRFVNKHFSGGKPQVKDVEEKLKEMEAGNDRLKMAVLLFLAVVIKGKQKENGPIDDFLLRAVDDLALCKSFPWGRFTYDDCLFNVYKTLDKFKADGTKTQCIPGFILPLEVLAFECIDVFKSKYREDVEPVEADCPLLCRGKFKKPSLKGFSLQELHETLGDSTAIHSTVVHQGEEDPSIAPSELYVNNPIVDGWNNIITQDGTIFWDDFYRLDVDSRGAVPLPLGPTGAALEEAVHQPVQEATQQATQQAAQEAVHPSVQEVVHQAAQEAAQEAVQVAVHQAVQEALKQAAQQAAAEAAQQAAQQAVNQAVQGIMKEMKMGFEKMEKKVEDMSERVYDLGARLRAVEEHVFKPTQVAADDVVVEVDKAGAERPDRKKNPSKYTKSPYEKA